MKNKLKTIVLIAFVLMLIVLIALSVFYIDFFLLDINYQVKGAIDLEKVTKTPNINRYNFSDYLSHINKSMNKKGFKEKKGRRKIDTDNTYSYYRDLFTDNHFEIYVACYERKEKQNLNDIYEEMKLYDFAINPYTEYDCPLMLPVYLSSNSQKMHIKKEQNAICLVSEIHNNYTYLDSKKKYMVNIYYVSQQNEMSLSLCSNNREKLNDVELLEGIINII